MGKYRFLITDMDGTLVTLDIDWDEIRKKVREIIRTDHPLKPLGPSILETTAGNEELRKRAFELVEDEEVRAALGASPDPELREMLSRLKKRGIRIALVTFQSLKPATIALKNLGVLPFFEFLITREYSLNRKEQLSITINRLQADPKRTVFAGDSPWDVSAGKELCCFTVVVGRNIEGADLYVERFVELEKLFSD
ncbi:MAG TPA: HAD family hydrolase [Candidatus Korarchaeota archaeon]|nr:HAD family hydrolase [Candidatus Korarchaeota archaeon]